ncbi:spore germination protein [Paenibacillus periandrae]|uniref:spore germination protein n=1 Tax=Paenibacillus periandrae TaxID=1761741 RepID=UPI001F09C371|nr:spore germination protein [Paenibacillus periandrae]
MLILKKLLKFAAEKKQADFKETVIEANERPSLEHTTKEFTNCIDFTHQSFLNCNVNVVYLHILIGNDEYLQEIIDPFSNATEEEAVLILERSQYHRIQDSKECIKGILDGQASIFFKQNTYLVDVAHPVGRSIERSETESVIVGPHDAFVENISQNLGVLRKKIKSSHLKTIKLQVGEVAKSDIIIVYMDGIANQELVQLLIQRIQNIEIDFVLDGNTLVQMIEENPNSIFPQFMTTERPDVVISKIIGGRIVGFLDGSPSAFSGPTSFFDFFSSPDDYYSRWVLGSATRILRMIGFILTLVLTALYVSATTYHYEMIPHAMLYNLTESRSKVPFPPLFEALMMETTIELLREAGARLPTKIGQTIGIVGGIVIGQAAVQAGFTSNILIMTVATSAIASFVVPSYIMSGSIRLIRFGFIILAGLLGNLGLIIGIGFMTIHLAGITSLGTSYLTPVSPLNLSDILDTFIRGPFWALKKRPSMIKTKNANRNKMRR